MRLALCLVVGALVQAMLLGLDHQGGGRQLRGDEGYYHGEAVQRAAGVDVPPFFLFPPAYPRFLAAIYRVFGPRRLAVELVQAALFLAAAAFFRLLLQRTGLDPLAVDGATLLFVVDPQT